MDLSKNNDGVQKDNFTGYSLKYTRISALDNQIE